MTLLGVPEVTEPMSNPPRRHSPFPGRQVGKGHQPLETHSSLLICLVVLAVAGQPCTVSGKPGPWGEAPPVNPHLSVFCFPRRRKGS